MKCPNCETELRYTEKWLDEQTLYFEITLHEGTMIQLSTVGGIMTNFEELLQETAKAIDRTASVFLKSFEMTDKTVKFGVLIVEKPNVAAGG